MASWEQKKAMMAAVPINPVARIILDLPDHIQTYVDLDVWKAQHGHEVSRAQGEAFRAAFDVHCEEHESMLKTSRDFGRLGNHAVTSPSHSREDRAPRKNQATSQDTAFENNRAPSQRQLVNAWGEPVVDDGLAHGKWAANGASPYKSSGKTHPHATSSSPNQRPWGRERDKSRNKFGKASTRPNSATNESFLRQQNLIPGYSGQIAQTQSDGHTHVEDGPSRRIEKVQETRARPGHDLDARDENDTAHHHTVGKLARQADAYGVARDENDAKRSAAQAERKVAVTKPDQSWDFAREKQAAPDVD